MNLRGLVDANYVYYLAIVMVSLQQSPVFASEAQPEHQAILKEYGFLNSLVMEEGLFISEANWQFAVEQNNTGDVEDSNRQLLSLAKFQLFAADDHFLVDYESDSFDDYHSVNWLYDSRHFSGEQAEDWLSEYSIQWDGFYSRNEFREELSSQAIDDVSWGSGIYGYALFTGKKRLREKHSGEHGLSQHDWFVQWGLGGRWQAIDIGVDQFFADGSRSQFFLPGIKLRWGVQSTRSESEGSLVYERNAPGVANTEKVQLSGAICANFFTTAISNCLVRVDSLANIDVGVDFEVLTADYQYTLGLGRENFNNSKQRIRLYVKGQYGFRERLLPHFQHSLGGLYSVRGYEEQLLAGDNTLELSAEYRLKVNLLPIRVEGWLLAFYDWGWWETNPVALTVSPVESTVERQIERQGEDGIVRSFGAGIELNYQQFVYSYLVWARALEDDGVEVDAGSSRLHGYIRIVF